MARFLRFLVRNWPLKVAAVAFATLLYAGLVVSQNARLWPGPVPIDVLRQPDGAFLLEALPDVTSIRYLAPADVAGRVGSGDFRAEVDLSTVTPAPNAAPVRVTVTVRALNPRIQVLGWEPQAVDVRLDAVRTRVVRVRVDHAAVPAGLVASDPQAEPSSVTVRGASSLVDQVHEAVARVTIDPGAINVDVDVPLFAADEDGEPVPSIDVEPEEVHVFIDVGPAQGTRSVFVAPSWEGTLPAGYALTDIDVDPPAVTVSGPRATLAELDSVPTAPIDLAGRRADATVDTRLELPVGVTAVDVGVVRVSLAIEEQSATRLFVAGLGLDGARPDRSYRVSVPDVQVTLEGRIGVLDRLDPADLIGRLEVSSLGIGTHAVPVRIRPPSGLRVVEVSPREVTVTVIAPPSPVLPGSSPSAGG